MAIIILFLLPITLPAQDVRFSADSTYKTIEHLSVTIGPRPMGSAEEREALDWAVSTFRRFGADSAYVIRFFRAPGDNNSTNTNSGTAVGIFRGVSDSTIVVGGHIDSADPEIPGANDNASGTATAIELARLWSQRPRHYTMVFAAFGGEERGLYGSRHFAEHYHDIDNVHLMFCVDMTAADDDIVTLLEADSMQTPIWLVRDAFRWDRELGIKKFTYPTHFSTINSLADGAGSDHIPFLNRGIPAIDFTVGINRSPIHTPQDHVGFVDHRMIDNCGRLIDSMIQDYQQHGIPSGTNPTYMLWQPFGVPVFIPQWLIISVDILAVVLAVIAFLFSRKHRIRIERPDRVRFSGWKLFAFVVVLAVAARLGDPLMQLVKGLRNPWFVHLPAYLWFTVFWLAAGLWIVLQWTKKWRFSPDPYVYTKRGLILMMIALIPSAVLSPRLGLYDAAVVILFSTAILVRPLWLKGLFVLLAPLPTLRLMFHEAMLFLGRMGGQIGMFLDTPFKNFLYHAGLTVLLIVSYVPFIYVFGYAAVSIPRVKAWLKTVRRPVFGIVVLVAILGYGIFLTTLDAYNEMWRPHIQVDARYDMTEQESKITLKGSENFKDVTVTSDTLKMELSGRSHIESIPVEFEADWFGVEGQELLARGVNDTVDVRWEIRTDRPWYHVTVRLEVDTLEIYDFQTDLNSRFRKGAVHMAWVEYPPEAIEIQGRLRMHPGARLIRTVSATYIESPVLLQVESKTANLRYRTRVTRRDTLQLEAPSLATVR